MGGVVVVVVAAAARWRVALVGYGSFVVDD